MAEPTTYEIVLRGRPSRRLLRPLLDDFTIDASPGSGADCVTRLVGDIGDPAHLHGIVAHLTSVNIDIISIAPAHAPASPSSSSVTAGTNLSDEPTASKEQAAADANRRTHLLHALPWLWLGFSAAWAVVILVTDELAWPLALWIATTVGPLTALKTRLDSDTDPRRSNR